MGKLVEPKVFFVGATALEWEGLKAYLRETDNLDFLESISAAQREGLSAGEVLTSFYAKLCYASLTLGKNANVTRIRDIPANLNATLQAGHGSVFEHCQLNFVVTDCSRVFTHELVRHRVGTAFSQTSGRYVRGDEVNIVFDPILEPVRGHVQKIQKFVEEVYRDMVAHMGLDDPDRPMDFTTKKKITSALRRMLPNGQSNEIGFSVNLRALRHTVMMRTGRHAEWEIRKVFGDIYHIIKHRYPMVFCDAKEEIVDDMIEVSGMKTNPWGQ